MTPQLHPLFVNLVPNLPLTADLFRYVVVNGRRDLNARFTICRNLEGSVYLGLHEEPTMWGEPSTPIAVAIIWDVPNRQFKLRSRTSEEQTLEGGDGSLGSSISPICPDGSVPHSTHLDYALYAVGPATNLLYSPELELAMIYKEQLDDREHEYVVQSVERGEPDLKRFDLERTLIP